MVWGCSSSSATRTDSCDELKCKPGLSLKRRGLSKHYSSKSQSFSSLELVLLSPYGESAVALSKANSRREELTPDGSDVLAPPSQNSSRHAGSHSLSRFSYDALVAPGSPGTAPSSSFTWSSTMDDMATDVMCEQFINALRVNNMQPPAQQRSS